MTIITMTGSAIGFALAIHLAFGVRSNVARFLSLFLFSLSVVLLEPLIDRFYSFQHLFAVLIGASTFLIGPSLFHYCKYRMTTIKKTQYDFLHYLPALIVLVSMGISSIQAQDLAKDSVEDVIVYIFLVLQIFTYCLLALGIAFRSPKIFSQSYPNRFHIVFVRLLVMFTLIMFTYSFLNTLLQYNTSSWFINSIQLVLNLAIISIALFNAEGLEKHRSYQT